VKNGVKKIVKKIVKKGVKKREKTRARRPAEGTRSPAAPPPPYRAGTHGDEPRP
jgi:hypothetical protein